VKAIANNIRNSGNRTLQACMPPGTKSNDDGIFCLPCLCCLPCEDDEEVDTTDGGIDLEIIVTGSSSEGNANVDGRGSGECSLGDWPCWFSTAAAVVSRGVRGLTSRLGGSSLTELAFGILERSVNKEAI